MYYSPTLIAFRVRAVWMVARLHLFFYLLNFFLTISPKIKSKTFSKIIALPISSKCSFTSWKPAAEPWLNISAPPKIPTTDITIKMMDKMNFIYARIWYKEMNWKKFIVIIPLFSSTSLICNSIWFVDKSLIYSISSIVFLAFVNLWNTFFLIIFFLK